MEEGNEISYLCLPKKNTGGMMLDAQQEMDCVFHAEHGDATPRGASASDARNRLLPHHAVRDATRRTCPSPCCLRDSRTEGCRKARSCGDCFPTSSVRSSSSSSNPARIFLTGARCGVRMCCCGYTARGWG